MLTSTLKSVPEGRIGDYYRVTRWKLGKADWSKFACCDEEFNRIDMSGEVAEINESIIKAILNEHQEQLERVLVKKKVKMVPRWNKECSDAIRNRNKIKIKINHSIQVKFYKIMKVLSSKEGNQKGKKDVLERILFNYWKNITTR